MHNFTDGVGAFGKTGEPVQPAFRHGIDRLVAVEIHVHGRLGGHQSALVVEQFDHPAIEPRLTGVPHTVVVQVVPLLTVDLRGGS